MSIYQGTKLVAPLGSIVTSVNGESGDISITPDSIGALPDSGGTISGSLSVAGNLSVLGQDIRNLVYSPQNKPQPQDLSALPYGAQAASIYPGKEITDSWATIRSKAASGNPGYNIGDYKTITLTTGEIVKLEVAGIDQYYNMCDQPVPHHIDFISKDCLVDTIQWNLEHNNNGTATENNPFRASNVFKWLNETVYNRLPSDLKNVVIEKRVLAPSRYSAGGAINDDTSWYWTSYGKCWLPSEVEVFGHSVWSKSGYETGGAGKHLQYPLFAGGARHIIKDAGNGGGRCDWWLSSCGSSSSAYACYVNGHGIAGYSGAAYSLRVPVCVRVG